MKYQILSMGKIRKYFKLPSAEIFTQSSSIGEGIYKPGWAGMLPDGLVIFLMGKQKTSSLDDYL